MCQEFYRGLGSDYDCGAIDTQRDSPGGSYWHFAIQCTPCTLAATTSLYGRRTAEWKRSECDAYGVGTDGLAGRSAGACCFACRFASTPFVLAGGVVAGKRDLLLEDPLVVCVRREKIRLVGPMGLSGVAAVLEASRKAKRRPRRLFDENDHSPIQWERKCEGMGPRAALSIQAAPDRNKGRAGGQQRLRRPLNSRGNYGTCSSC